MNMPIIDVATVTIQSRPSLLKTQQLRADRHLQAVSPCEIIIREISERVSWFGTTVDAEVYITATLPISWQVYICSILHIVWLLSRFND